MRESSKPLTTTRGDRLFIGLLGSAYIQLGWLAFTDLTLWWSLGLAVVFMIAILRWG